MITFINLPPAVQSIIGLYSVLLFLASTAIIVSALMHKHWKGIAGMVPVCICLYFIVQVIFDIRSGTYVRGALIKAEKAFGDIYCIVLMGVLLIFSFAELCMYLISRKWIKGHITAASIKEAVDNLPIGICCYEPNGQIVLKNHRIEGICKESTKSALLNAVAFLNQLNRECKQTQKGNILQLENGEVYTFCDRDLGEKDLGLRMLSMVDITTQYQNTKTLEEKQQVVAELNEELTVYGKQIVESIAAKEILDAKVKIHDELGMNLLASKRYILTGGTESERAAIEAVLRRNLRYLKQETENTSSDEYAVILETARDLEIRLNVIGELTELEPQRHIIVTGIHECLTNTIRHAGGDELNVRLEETENEIMAEFTNNGRAPEQKIQERGGLALLRSLAEKGGGTMAIDSDGRFVLTLRLKK